MLIRSHVKWSYSDLLFSQKSLTRTRSSVSSTFMVKHRMNFSSASLAVCMAAAEKRAVESFPVSFFLTVNSTQDFPPKLNKFVS